MKPSLLCKSLLAAIVSAVTGGLWPLDLATPVSAETASPVRFEKRVLTEQYYCDGVNAADFDRDGHMDIVAGPYWYAGPDFTAKRELYTAKPFETAPGPTNSMFSFVHDFNGDGRVDVVLNDGWWEQPPPGEAERPWTAHPFRFSKDRGGAQILVYDVDGAQVTVVDVNGDGRPDILTVSKLGSFVFLNCGIAKHK